MKFNIFDVLPRIAEPLKGADDEYVKLVRNYHDFYLDTTRTEEAKRQARARTHNAIRELKQSRIEQAKNVIEQVREEYTEKPAGGEELSDQAKLYNLMLWKEIIPHADTDELRELYLQNGSNEDFMKLLKVEFKKRGDNDLGVQRLKNEIEKGPETDGLEDLDRVKKSLNFIASQPSMWAQELAEGVELDMKNIKYRQIERDLDAFPVEHGATRRPEFRMGVNV